MLVIRLFRVGKKNQPSFKIVVADKKRPTRAGRFVEEVGFYNPQTKEKVLKGERIKYWLSVGAKPSPTIHNLLVSEKIIEAKKTPIYIKKKAKKEEKPVAEAPAAKTTEVKEEKPKEEKPTVTEPVKAPAPEPAPETPVKEEKAEAEKPEEPSKAE